MPYTTRITVGKLSTQTPKFPSEPGYIAQIQAQMSELEKIYTNLFNKIEGVLPEILLNALGPTKILAETYTPVKTGALRASSYLEVTDRGQTPRVELGFGKGGQPEYAVYVHEMVEIPHKPPTRAKFLQSAVLEDQANVEKRILEQLAFSETGTIGY
jgi:hypothetical protein